MPYWDNFAIGCQLDAAADGLLATVQFSNKSLPSLPRAPSVEVWYPIAGHLEYVDQGPQQRRILVGSIHEVGSGNNQFLDLKIDPGKNISLMFYIKVDLAQAERMRELAEKSGTVTLLLHLYFSVLYDAGTLNQKTYGLHPVFRFDVSKAQMQEWIKGWNSSHARSADLPRSVPENVLDDYSEAVSTFNVSAYKASVAMARRALQQALEDKGATKGSNSNLFKQIDELKSKGLLSEPAFHLAQAVRAFGNYGAHPNDDLLAQITHEDAETALMAAKKILKELYK